MSMFARSGEQESSRTAIVINGLLDCPQQVRSELHLVYDPRSRSRIIPLGSVWAARRRKLASDYLPY